MVNKINASHILVKTEQEALALLTYMRQGKSFEELAKERSLCPSGKKGGNLGWFGRGQMAKEFENAAFSGNAQKSGISGTQKTEGFRGKGQIMGPVKTQFGWHLIRINDTA